ncbi:MAG: flavin reductase family protein [Deltaproteobacteria bacterium]|nr:flavin reductase family protein [Deltaproteobacteria bacterium]
MKKKLGASPVVFPLPAVLVATYDEDGTPNAMTAAWAASCCHDPPCVGVAVRSNRLTFKNIEARGAFTINIPSTRLAKEVDYLGIVSGKRQPDKLARVGLETEPCPTADAPLLLACPVAVECELYKQLEIGTHTWFVGRVLEVHVDEQVLEEDGTIDVVRLDPLAYATSAGAYHALGKSVGRAYRIGKDLKTD